jgi:hypothetical protein
MLTTFVRSYGTASGETGFTTIDTNGGNCVIVGLCQSDTSTLTVTLGGRTMTRVGYTDYGGSHTYPVSLYYLANPPVGSSVTLAISGGSVNYYVAAVFSFSNEFDDADVAAVWTDYGTSTTITLDTVADGMVIHFVYADAYFNPKPAGWTTVEEYVPGGDKTRYCLLYKQATSTSMSTEWQVAYGTMNMVEMSIHGSFLGGLSAGQFLGDYGVL